MPTAPTALNHSLIKIARGVPVELWAGIAPNAAGIVVLDLPTGRPDTTLNPSAVNIGYTQDGIEVSRGVTPESLPVDQSFTDIAQALQSQDVHLKTKVLQVRDYANMVLLNPGTAAMTGTGYTGMHDQQTQTITLLSYCAVAPSPNDATKWLVIVIYAGYNIAPFTVTLGKKWNVSAVDIKAEDAARADGATWAWYETTV